MGFPGLTLFLPDKYEFQQVHLNSDLQIHKGFFLEQEYGLKKYIYCPRECLPLFPQSARTELL